MLFLLTVGVFRWSWLASVDLAVRHFFVTHQRGVVTSVAGPVVRLGSVAVAVPALGLAATFAAVRRRSARPLLVAAFALAFVATTGLLLKAAVGRSSASFAALPETGVGGSSFPSGHAALAMTCWVLVALLVTDRRAVGRVPAVGFAVVVALAVGAGMVYGPGHWLADVLAGWALGVAAASLVRPILYRSDHDTSRRSDPN